MISGIGIDLIEVERIQLAIERWGDRFLQHVFTDEEIDYARQFKNSAEHFAGRFAAKEAIFKAVSIQPHLGWRDIQIANDKNGKPYCRLKLKRFNKKILLSISHTHLYAVATAVIVK